MPYPPRICFDGAIYHVTARGDNREPIFFDDSDYRKYLRLLQRYKRECGFVLYAYALMPNHIHLLIGAMRTMTISGIMQRLGIAYTRYFNARHKRVGHVFQGRFHSKLIDQDVYLLVASRYVHLNPVRAQLVKDPATYPWSSYRSYRESPDHPRHLADTSLVLSLVSQGETDPVRQVQSYCTFVETATLAEIAQEAEWLKLRI